MEIVGSGKKRSNDNNLSLVLRSDDYGDFTSLLRSAESEGVQRSLRDKAIIIVITFKFNNL
jgi:hypothetical protein